MSMLRFRKTCHDEKEEAASWSMDTRILHLVWQTHASGLPSEGSRHDSSVATFLSSFLILVQRRFSTRCCSQLAQGLQRGDAWHTFSVGKRRKTTHVHACMYIYVDKDVCICLCMHLCAGMSVCMYVPMYVCI